MPHRRTYVRSVLLASVYRRQGRRWLYKTELEKAKAYRKAMGVK